MAGLLQNALLQDRRNRLPRMPWEVGAMGRVFGGGADLRPPSVPIGMWIGAEVGVVTETGVVKAPSSSGDG